MKSLRSTGLVLMLIACGEDSTDETTNPTVVPSTETTSTTTPTVTSTEEWQRTTTSTTTESDVDPWVVFSSAVQRKDAGETSAQITELLEARELQREIEDRQIQRALIDVQRELTMSCRPDGIDDSFADFQEAERASLQADRDTLSDILDLAGSDGRYMIWEAGSPSEVIPTSRERMADRLTTNLESSWVNTQTEEQSHLSARQIMAGLTFGIEGLNMDVQQMLAQFQMTIQSIDADASMDWVNIEEVMTALTRVDETLLESQAYKFGLLTPACEAIGPDTWLRLLERRQIASYIGQVGGTTGITTTSSSSSSSSNQRSSTRGDGSRRSRQSGQGQGQGQQTQGQGQQAQGLGQQTQGQGQGQQLSQGQGQQTQGQGQRAQGQQLGQGQRQ